MTKTSNDLAQDRTDLATQRTIMATDRSLLASLRTSLSMIGFGFTIYKFLQQVSVDTGKKVLRDATPRNIGLFLCGLGTFTLIMEMVSYWKSIKVLNRNYKCSPWRVPLFNAAGIALMGSFLFGMIIITTLSR